MEKREIVKTITGQRTVDGAGVKLVRVFGNKDTEAFDPFLMLDSFDSVDPSDYKAGFPMHPHRGIETITYLISGRIVHEDSLGNKGSINAGESQWMTAGCGIMHQEMPVEAGRMLGFQLWLNLPSAEKMCRPEYLSITEDMIPRILYGTAKIRIIAGRFNEINGVKPRHIPASIYDVYLPKNDSVEIAAENNETVFIFTIDGEALIEDDLIKSKTAVLFGKGDYIKISAPENNSLRFIYFSGKALKEPVAWGGPIVMNTKEELMNAFEELRNGTFIKNNAAEAK